MFKIKELCKRRGITQKELAEQLGTTERTITATAKGNASIPMLQRVAAALGVTVPELFEDQPAPVIRCPHCKKLLDLIPKEEGDK